MDETDLLADTALAADLAGLLGARGTGSAHRRKATVTAWSPSAVTLSLGGVSVAGVPYLGGYIPRVGDAVEVLVDGAALLVLGRVAPQATPACRVDRNTDVTVANDTAYVMQWERELLDNDGIWSPGAPGRLTASRAGM